MFELIILSVLLDGICAILQIPQNSRLILWESTKVVEIVDLSNLVCYTNDVNKKKIERKIT